MFNLYPVRATNIRELENEKDKRIHQQNIKEIISEILADPQEEITIWAAWGNLIDPKNNGRKDYLYRCLYDIYKTISQKKNIHCVTIGTTKQGHPRHPLYEKTKSCFHNFAMEHYISKIVTKAL